MSNIYNEEEAFYEWIDNGQLNEFLVVGFPYATKIIGKLTKQLRCSREIVEEAIQETWMELYTRDLEIRNAYAFLLSHVRNRARNLIRKEQRQEKLKHEFFLSR